MSIDNLLSAEVVTADGRVLTASLSENEDLFWALRGGGGNFGVVTSFEFQAHPVHTVLGGLLLYPRDAAVDVIRFFRDFIEVCSRRTHGVRRAVAWSGWRAADRRDRLLLRRDCRRRTRAATSPLIRQPRSLTRFNPMPFPAMQSLLGPSFPDGNHNYWKSTLQRNLSDDAIAAIVEHANRMASPLSAVVLEYYGGAAGRVPNDATAYPHRDLPWDILFIAQWTDPARRAFIATGPAPGRRSFGPSLRTPICFRRSTSNPKRSFTRLSAPICRAFPP